MPPSSASSAPATSQPRVPRPPPVLYAHRGAAARHPENTLTSFGEALDQGANALETDAHRTVDGVVVLSHDGTGRRMAGIPRAIATSPWHEVRQWDVGWGFVDPEGGRPFVGRGVTMPTLAEALAAFPGVVFNVDAKDHTAAMVRDLVEVVRKAKAQDRVRIASFSERTLRAVRRLGYEGETGLGRSAVARAAFLPAALLRGPLSIEGHAAQVPMRVGPLHFDEAPRITRLQALGLRVDFWTVNDVEEGRRLLAAGADGLMTDDPALLAPLFRT